MNGSVLTLGTFDGVHRGHREIFRSVARRARLLCLTPAALTFTVPPRLFFFPSPEASLLTTVAEKKELFKECGIERIWVLKFDSRLAHMSAEAFFSKYVAGICKAREVIVGYNFVFGKNREGDARFLEEAGRRFGIGVKILPPIVAGAVPVSSGRIREALRDGDLERANAFLGSPYAVTGRVVIGRKLGQKLGFPTANLETVPEKIIPPGVFAVQAVLPGGRMVLGGMANSGFRPTVAGPKKKSLEVHIFGFSGNLYGKTLKIRLVRKLRDEKAFGSLADLARQLEKDRARAQKILDARI